DDNYGWDDGLICGGRMTILADPLARASASPIDAERMGRAMSYYRAFERMVTQGEGCTEAVLIADKEQAPAGSRYLFDAAGKLLQALGPMPPPTAVEEHLPDLKDRPRPQVQQGVTYLPVLPRITLLIVGGGHVGQAVARLAADVDFDVWVTDDRDV